MKYLSQLDFAKATDFVLANARVLERRLLAYHFFDGTSTGVKHAVLAYQKEDGGFGHGLEPDSSSPESQPLYTLMAMEYLDEANALDSDIINRALDFLSSVTNADAGLPWMLSPVGQYPRASHFEEVSKRSAINPTAPVLGILLKHGVNHSWMEKAEEFCMAAIEKSDELNTGFGCHCVTRRMAFLDHCLNREWAQIQVERIKANIKNSEHMCRDLISSKLGLFGTHTPINFAPTPSSTLYSCFSTDEIGIYLDAFVSAQKEDGSWKTDYGISDGTRLGWNGMFTLWVLKALKAHRRIETQDGFSQVKRPTETADDSRSQN